VPTLGGSGFLRLLVPRSLFRVDWPTQARRFRLSSGAPSRQSRPRSVLTRETTQSPPSWRALCYIRQSRHKDYERTASPEVQRQACTELPAVKACDSIEFFEDLDVSGGKTKKRVNLARLLARVESARKDDHEVAVVAAYD
jgi:ABC-type hemin transport system ATPase subunit